MGEKGLLQVTGMKLGGVPRVFFVHVMKTAGTTFTAELRRQLGPENVYPRVPTPDQRGSYWHIQKLLDVPEERHLRLKAYAGHFPFFVAEQLVPFEVEILCMLREPVARTVSWLRQEQDASGTRSMEDIYADDLTRRRLVVNHQTKIFSLERADHAGSYLKNVDIDEARLEWALQRLERVSVLGVQERVDDFMTAVNRRYGWSLRTEERLNVSTLHPVPPGLLERIREDVSLDTVLYERALELATKAPSAERLDGEGATQPL